MIRIVLVDDDESLAVAFEALLNEEEDVQVAGLCFHWREAAGEVQRLRPDLVLMDVSMPDDREDAASAEPEGIRAIRAVREADPRVPILAFTGRRRPEWEARALQAGARRYLPKEMPRERLLKAIREAVTS